MIGWDWPFSFFWFFTLAIFLFLILFIHGRSLIKSTIPALAWKLIALRSVATILLLTLIARPFISTNEPNPKDFHLLALTDLSGSMNVRDGEGEPTRIKKVMPFVDSYNDASWLNELKKEYGKVESLGFSDDLQRMNRNSISVAELGRNTALGDALSVSLRNSNDGKSIGSVVIFSDGRNNMGASVLEVAKEYRSAGIPVNVIGVGKDRPSGDVSISFADRNPKAVAKEELLLSALVENKFKKEIKPMIKLMTGKKVVQEIRVTLDPGKKKEITFSPVIPKTAGPRRYRIMVDLSNGDSDMSNNSDSLLVLVKPPDQFSTLYLSNKVHPLYPFLKRVLAEEERFDFKALVRLSKKVFHAFGEGLNPEYPTDDGFWMDYDALVLDAGTLDDLNETLVLSLKNYVQKKGGGLLIFGDLETAREKLGGIVPAKEVEKVVAKDNLSLVTLEEPLFSPVDEVEKMKPFLPKRLPGFFVSDQNKASRGVVLSRANGKPVLVVQAYGAGKVAYWGSPGDWRRSMDSEEGAEEFRHFWQSLIQWLGTGGEDRLKTLESTGTLLRGSEALLQVDALGSDFEPSMDAMVEAEILGPGDYNETLQLYPAGANAGRYAGSFRPMQSGAYEVNYKLRFPDGETLRRENYIRVSEAGEESLDISFAKTELQMLANLTGGEYLQINEMNRNWRPVFAENLPTVKKRHSLANAWVVFVLLFLIAGSEWIMRRQAGMR